MLKKESIPITLRHDSLLMWEVNEPIYQEGYKSGNLL
jgi:hypothetical protein